MERKPDVIRQVHYVKMLHTIIMLVWPIVTGALAVLVAVGLRHLDVYKVFGLIMVTFWLFYSYFMLTVMRNFNLQNIAVTFCDFDAYLECMKFLEKFYLNRQACLGQHVNRTDAYLIMGDFQGAYQNLMDLYQQINEFSLSTRMMYDYFWCRFYAEVEDRDNFQMCLKRFRDAWVNQKDLRRSLMQRAELLEQELDFREMIFLGRNGQAQEYLLHLYKAHRLSSRYEFVKYCYFMGRTEFAMDNLTIAKHWFAQTVSFGLREHMSQRAQQFLDRLEEMHVPYAMAPPENNICYSYASPIHMASGVASILMGLIVILMLFLT